jgi:peptide/nickel transport system substrate-binding protein
LNAILNKRVAQIVDNGKGSKVKGKLGSKAGVSHRNQILAIVLVAVIIGVVGVGYILTQPAPFPGIVMGTTDSVQTTIDPANAYDFFGWEIIQALSSGLVEYRAGSAATASDILPALATNWSVSPNGMNYTFSLRHGVLYDDGTEFNATWAKYSIDRGIALADPDGAFVGIGIGNLLMGEIPETGGIINKTVVVDKYTLRIQLNNPTSFFMSLLAGTMMYMVDPLYGGTPPFGEVNATGYWHGNLTKESRYIDGNPRASHPCGLGPYRLTQWIRSAGKDQVMRLDANPNYWNASGGYPKTSAILIKFYTTSTGLATAMQAGDVDIAFRQLDAATINSMKSDSSLKVWEGTGAFIQYLVFQTNTPPFDDVRVRQAVAACVNRTHISAAFSGSVNALFSMIPNGMAYHEDSFAALGNPNYTEAIALLAAAGYNSGNKLQVPLHYESSGHYPQSVTLATTLKTDLEKSGVITVTTTGTDWTTYKTDWAARSYPVWIMGWYPDYIDPDDYIYPFYHTNGASWLYNDYSNSTVDDYIIWGRGNTTDVTRNPLYSHIQDMVFQDCPIVPLYQGGAFAVTKLNIYGVYLDVTQNWRHWLLYKV